MPTAQIINAAVGQLRAHPANVHAHSKKQLGQIARSIRRFGFTAPIIVDENNVILAGHGRWLAAQHVGLERVPTVILSGLSEAERRAYLLADNKLVENAGWDRAGLAVELKELAPLLASAGLDISLTGFQPAEIDTLMGDLIDPERDPADEVPPPRDQATSRIGDLWGARPAPAPVRECPVRHPPSAPERRTLKSSSLLRQLRSRMWTRPR
ncbi:MAG: ParB/Srx family N-terminal domain-containing protein [Rhodoplanes sp.]